MITKIKDLNFNNLNNDSNNNSNKNNKIKQIETITNSHRKFIGIIKIIVMEYLLY